MEQTQSGRLGLSGKSAWRMVKALFDTNILVDYPNEPDRNCRPFTRQTAPGNLEKI